jgi:hypothetical protein
MQRGSGHLAASGVPGHCRAGEPWSTLGSKPESAGVYGGQPLSFALYGKATGGRPRSEPDWGKPTVRDRRGACGNVDHGGTRHPPRLSKERVLETLHLKLCAPQIYPDRSVNGELLSRVVYGGRILLANSKPLSFSTLIFSPAQERLD